MEKTEKRGGGPRRRSTIYLDYIETTAIWKNRYFIQCTPGLKECFFEKIHEKKMTSILALGGSLIGENEWGEKIRT